MDTIMKDLKDIFDNDFEGYPENIKKGTNLYFLQPNQPHKNAVIERFAH
jgi:hypothetical protein